MPKQKKNKTDINTDKIRDLFASLVELNARKLQQDFLLLDAEKRIKYTIELAKFVVPLLKSVELSGGELDLNINILPADLRKKLTNGSDNDVDRKDTLYTNPN